MPKAKRTLKEFEDNLMESLPARKTLFSQLLKHVSDGYSFDSFPFCHMTTVHELFERFPDDFPIKELELAMQNGKQCWEDIGKRQATGSCMGNSRAWVYNMINRYKWSDKLEVNADVKGKLDISIINYGSPTNLP